MTERARRRRGQRGVKEAFQAEENGQEKMDTKETEAKPPKKSKNKTVDKKNNDIIDPTTIYEKGFFSIQNITVEVILNKDVLSWATVIGDHSREETSRRKSTSQDKNSVNLHDVFAITPIHENWSWSLNVNETVAGTTITTSNSILVPGSTPPSNNSSLRGFQLHSYQDLPDNILQEILIIFQSNDSNMLDHWHTLLTNVLSLYRSKKNILVLCNPYAGPRHSRHTYNMEVKPILERAQYKATYLEIDDQNNADDVINNLEIEFDSIDSLIIMGGDGSVISVINALIRYLAKQNRIRLEMDNDLPSIPFPICIIPEGTTNIISHTIQGNIDHCTPILHLLFNRKMKIDMSAIFDTNHNFVTANFSCAAGYPANALKYFPRYNLHSPKTIIKKSFAKAASRKNLQPLMFDIRYVPANQHHSPFTRCYKGCSSCAPEPEEQSTNEVQAFDDSHLQKLSSRRKSASKNNDNQRLSSAGKVANQNNNKEKNWKTLQSEYLQVMTSTNACLWSFAPQGLSKYAHIADGLLDLILIEPVSRKEFLRYVKRNGNSKNQYDFSFTKLIKAKEIEIEIKLPADYYNNDILNTDNQIESSLSDDSSNENVSDNENKGVGNQKHQPRPPSAPISEESRRLRRRNHRPMETAASESLQNTGQPIANNELPTFSSKYRKHSENGLDNLQNDPYGSTTSLRRSGFLQSFKSKRDKIPLPRPSSARGDPDDEKPLPKSRKSFVGNLRPARSLLNLLSANGGSSGNHDKSFGSLSRDSFATENRRRSSIISRSSSMDNTKQPFSNNDLQQKRPCVWNLDFTPYNAEFIRIKCFYRYLTVYGVGINPETRLKEINYNCFGRMG